MNEWEMLERFLRTDPRDVGCDEAMAVLHVYADLVAASQDAGAHYPGVTVHLAACGPCGEDFAGLLAAVTGEQPSSRTPGLDRGVGPAGPGRR
jgi:hypothetical protein